ncbi:MAG: ATP-grasp domain-containing protein [Ruminococcus flavefaciens]|nr:ATP-grasp domain-containing protein [Ruminococcus flavefaciens]
MNKFKFIWIIQDSNRKHYNWTELYKAVIELNSNAVYVSLDKIEHFIPPNNYKPIVIGGDDFLKMARRNPFVKDGIYFYDNLLRVDSYINLFGKNYLNFDMDYVSINKMLSESFVGFFARPIYDNKCFDGEIIKNYSQIKSIFNQCKQCFHYGEKCICISSVKRISSEWRAVIVNGRISEICCYSSPDTKMAIPSTLIDFCNECLLNIPKVIALVIDIAESDNNYYVLECNIFNACNFYSCNRHNIVKDLENSLLNLQ